MGSQPPNRQGGFSKGDFHSRYVLGKKLGQGCFGQVRVATDWTSQEQLVAKILDLRRLDSKKDPFAAGQCPRDDAKHTTVLQEVKMWRRVPPSPHVVRLAEAFSDDSNCIVYLVMERCQCSLLDKLSSMADYSESEVRGMFREVAVGLRHIHASGILHRDVKPQNILLGLDGKIKLADFGSACCLRRAWPWKPARAGGVAGTVPYMSPEMLQGLPYDDKTDLWSFGVVLYCITFGGYPYGYGLANADAMKAAILEGKPPTYKVDSRIKYVWQGEHLQFQKAFIRSVLTRDPAERLSAQMALEHEFLDERLSFVTSNSDASSNFSQLIQMAKETSLQFEQHQEEKSQHWASVASTFESHGLDMLLEQLQQEAELSGTGMRFAFSCPTKDAEVGKSRWLPALSEEPEGYRSETPITPSRAHSKASRASLHRPTWRSTAATEGDEDSRSTEFVSSRFSVDHADQWSSQVWHEPLADDDATVDPTPWPRAPPCHASQGCRGSV